ncbi:MAG TPA: acetyl/propionyl/methylcrotonyl-CoA carboxylase subunit alpha [Aquabacterium sp.]|nr:acetyl/propionyl/methylcrotonyl-CoA carboxylase subunit alpha [Aquabacterium sp.]
MFTKLLIANRGEIACRVAATARRLGIRTVAVYADADAHSAHVQACDEAIHLGPSPARDSYLRGDLILAAARSTGAQAIHPGYGFLSENADFAIACAQAGVTFVGPPAYALAAMGDKAAAKRLMTDAGVPLVPGYHGPDQDLASLQAHADAIGYPLLIKATAGGGGKGMRVVECAADFATHLASCQREAQASFGNAQVLLERYLPAPRHIEVQIFADQHGHAVHLFERDCSVQRRHQKVLEEAPAPGMSPLLRERMGQAALTAALSVGYVGAGTVEFIAEQDVARTGRFYFMEMNTRLQVEHPVTEAITGLDLVEWQLRVAKGQDLPLRQDQITSQGHAIEARVCAENPRLGFLPSTGTLHGLREPQASHFEPSALRIDSGVRQGDAISPYYDAMIAKVIAHGKDRPEALQRLDQALQGLQIAGVHTNIDLIRRVLHTPAFQQGRIDTHLIEQHQAALMAPASAEAEALAVAALMAHHQTLTTTCTTARMDDPWQQADGWRLHGSARQHWQIQPVAAGPTDTVAPIWSVTLHRQPGQRLRLDLHRPGQPVWSAELDHQPASSPSPHQHTLHLRVGDTAESTIAVGVWPQPHAPNHRFDVFTPQGQVTLAILDPLQRQPTHTRGDGTLRAPMPGRVVAIDVPAGQPVTAGQRLIVTEAMKMEHPLCAPCDGILSAWLCQVGEQVAEGQELLRVTPHPTA